MGSMVTEDIALAENIFGKDVGTLKGKTVKLVDMLLELDPTYESYVVYENGQKTLYFHTF